MPVCKFFSSKSGCARGDQCYYQHGLPPVNPADRAQSWRKTRNESDQIIPAGASLANFPDPVAKVSCRYYSIGACKNGDSCRFRHEGTRGETSASAVPQHGGNGQLTDEQQDSRATDGTSPFPSCGPTNIKPTGHPTAVAPGLVDPLAQNNSEPHPPKTTSKNVRDLGGAVVRFGPGGDILNIETAAASTARLQMCNVSCIWYQPSITATLKFTSSQAMEEAARSLAKTKILNRTLECRTAVDKKTTPWQCYVKIGNLDKSTTTKMLVGPCGRLRPQDVTFGKASYSSSADAIGQAVHRLLSTVGTLEDWTPSTSTKGAQSKAIATFSTVEQAAKVVTELNGHKLPQLGGSQILLSHIVKAKFSILSSIYNAISSDLENVRQSGRSQIRSYPSTHKPQIFTTLHIISDTAQEVARTKAAVESILKGHTARGAKGIIWDKLFLKPEGIAYLNDLGKGHDVFIYRNAKKCILSLYGKEANKAVVESALLKAVEDLAVSTFNLDLDEKVSVASHQAAYRRIVENLGKTAVRLNIATMRKTITIHGSAGDAEWAKAVLLEESGEAHDTGTRQEEDLICAVCWCDVTETYTTSCGHVYDKECFVNQCLSAGDKDIPIRCLGSSGTCQTIISFAELDAALTRDQLDKLLEDSFTRHVRTHPAKYQYCPTADCDQVYEVSDDGKVFTCRTCLTTICTKCGAVSHEELTCDQYKKAILGDDAFEIWKKKNDARNCPKCGCVIQKSEGCNHMECKPCGAHICWVCMEVFGTGPDTYGHMTAQHGSFYDHGDGFDGFAGFE